MEIDELWINALERHNEGAFHDAHELFEDLWMELDNRIEKDIVQTLAQIDALAVHLNTQNLKAAQRLMRQLPELITTMPKKYRDVNLVPIKKWIEKIIEKIPKNGKISEIKKSNPPALI